MNEINSTAVVQAKSSAEVALEQLGFAPGAPAHITRASQDIDAQVARKLRCPACRKRGMDYRPFHRGRAYAALAVCRCGAGEDL
jgi:hypothetical protein